MRTLAGGAIGGVVFALLILALGVTPVAYAAIVVSLVTIALGCVAYVRDHG